MTKPDDISEEAWNAAIVELGPAGVHVHANSYHTLVDRIARAILSAKAEQQAKDASVQPLVVELPGGTYGLAMIEAYWKGVSAGKESVRAAIRAGV